MKKTLFIFAAIVLMAGFTTKVMGQATDTKPNNANAQILGAIALTAVNPLEFGSMNPGATVGTVVLTTLNVATASGGVVLVAGIPTAASYTVTGAGSRTYAITIPVAPFNVTCATAQTMAVTAMNCSYAGLTSTFTVGGTDAFTVGGTLNVALNQVVGIYTGTFPVTVAYN